MESYETNPIILIFIIILFTLISLIIVFGNSMTIFVILRNKKMQNITNYFITNLAIADIIIGLFVTPFQVNL